MTPRSSPPQTRKYEYLINNFHEGFVLTKFQSKSMKQINLPSNRPFSQLRQATSGRTGCGVTLLKGPIFITWAYSLKFKKSASLDYFFNKNEWFVQILSLSSLCANIKNIFQLFLNNCQYFSVCIFLRSVWRKFWLHNSNNTWKHHKEIAQRCFPEPAMETTFTWAPTCPL